MFRSRARRALGDEDVVLIYRTLLDRTPSPAEIEVQRGAADDWHALLSAVAASEEYARRLLPSGDLADPAHTVNTWHPDLAVYARPAGEVSSDGNAVVGRDGWLFLVRGANSVLDQYQEGFAVADDWVDRWTDAVEVRRAEAARLGADLALLVVPDKISVLDHALPAGVELRRTPPAAQLAAHEGLGILYPVPALRAVGDAYLRTDTHLSLAGNVALADEVLGALGVRPGSVRALPTHEYLTSGDLGSKFAPPIVEVVTTYNSWGSARLVADNRDEVAAAGRHVGTRRVLHNDDAPDTRVAVVFGDSYALPEPHYQGFAWFLAQVFREVHFVWSPFGWDKDYVTAVSAGVVVCETAERFVPRAPEPRIDVDELVRSVEGGGD